MVALGSMPLGSVLRATGTGNTFTAFSAYNTPGVPILTLSPSVETAFDGFSLAATVSRTGATSLTFYRYAADSTLTTSTSPTLTKTITSGPDVDYDIAGYDVHTFVAFMDDGTMGLLSWSGYMGSGWSTPQYFGPPSGTTFQYSPSICQVHSMIDASPVHLVAAAGDRLWHSYFTAAGYTAWEKISDIAVASAPDCAVSSHCWGSSLLARRERFCMCMEAAVHSPLLIWGCFSDLAPPTGPSERQYQMGSLSPTPSGPRGRRTTLALRRYRRSKLNPPSGFHDLASEPSLQPVRGQFPVGCGRCRPMPRHAHAPLMNSPGVFVAAGRYWRSRPPTAAFV